MKKRLLILAVAGLALASCSNDEVVESVATSDANAISFRSSVAGQTRAADITTDGATGITAFNAEAFFKGTTLNPYFSNVTFTKNGSTFTSAVKYYWPANKNLDFYAYSPITEDVSGNQKGAYDETVYQIVKTDYKTFTIHPSSDITKQVDFVYANTNNWGKATTETTVGHIIPTAQGVNINFRHTESKIVLKVKNSDPNLKFEVMGFKIVNVDGEATFTYGDTNTDGNNTDEAVSGTTLTTGWATDNIDDQTVTYTTGSFNNLIPASQATAEFLNHSGAFVATSSVTDEAINMILIPQTTSAATAYSGSNAGDAISSGSYIAIKMKIRNNDLLGDDGTGEGKGTLIEDASGDGYWAIWPVAFNWSPGKKYTYIIDLGDGGYWEKNKKGDSGLDPVLDGAEIKFVTVTVDDWDAINYAVPQIPQARSASYAFANEGSETINLPAGANGAYTITITGLTEGKAITAVGTNNFTAAPTVSESPVPSSGKITITGTLSPNTTTAVTSNITVTNTTDSQSMTISIVQAAP